MESDWQEINRVAALPPQQPTVIHTQPALAFDTNSDLLWIGNDQGYITSYNGPELRKYTSYCGHASSNPHERMVRQLMFNDRGVISVAPKSIHFSSRGGLAQWNLQDGRFQNLSCMAYTSRGTSEVVVGGGQKEMFTVNLERGTVVAEMAMDDEIKVIKRSPRHIVVGTAKGDAKLLDMNSFKVVKEFLGVHNGTILDMDTHDNLMITCGYSMRCGAYMVDPLVKIYDLRMQKALPPVSFPGAAFLRMHPKMTAAAIIASSAGSFQVADVMNPGACRVYHANIQTYITAMDLSPTGDFLAMADAEGIVQIWSAPGKKQFTDVGAPIDWPEPPVRSTATIDDNTPLNSIGMPYYREELFSAWPQHLVFEIPKEPMRIDADILAHSSTAGYAPYHGRKPRNFVERSRKGDEGIVQPKFLSQQGRAKNSIQPKDDKKGHSDSALDVLLAGDDTARLHEVPASYRKLEIKYSRFGVDDFDFQFYNKTTHSGLETNIPNSYMNPLLQLYKFTPALRNVALEHTAGYCTKEDCTLCQMGFLFDMLEKAGGINCQATNFLKTFSSLPAAATHGVLEEHSPSTGSMTLMMQNLNRLMLNITINDQNIVGKGDEPELSDILMIKSMKSQRCSICHKETRPAGDTVTSDLIYSPKPVNAKKPLPTFAQTVKQSIQVETTHKGWCDQCRRYQLQGTRKSISHLPDVLTFNASSNDKNLSLAREYWGTPGWLPDQIGIALNNNHLNVWQGDDVKVLGSRSNDVKIYDLVGYVAEIKEEDDRRKHMVSFINVALSSEHPTGEQPNWHLFNDFLVRKVPHTEALSFTRKWKLPSVLIFQLRSPRSTISHAWQAKINPWILYTDFNYMGTPRREPTVIPLNKDTEEPPCPGTLIALDAEFVSLQTEESEVKADGSRVVVRPSSLGLARVSVLRGSGELEETPFLDDYISTKDNVVDFLTEYSGIHPGDLDPLTSRHALVSLKVAYKRLWILLNLGCVFIGHGLLKDFRIINLHVPRHQVIDTVDLFILRSSNRKLSLRFLAWNVLGDAIQTETHDSIEDARTALKLFKKYQEYTDAGVIDQILDRIYTEGIRCGFKPPVPVAGGQVGRLQHGASRSESSTPGI